MKLRVIACGLVGGLLGTGALLGPLYRVLPATYSADWGSDSPWISGYWLALFGTLLALIIAGATGYGAARRVGRKGAVEGMKSHGGSGRTVGRSGDVLHDRCGGRRRGGQRSDLSPHGHQCCPRKHCTRKPRTAAAHRARRGAQRVVHLSHVLRHARSQRSLLCLLRLGCRLARPGRSGGGSPADGRWAVEPPRRWP